MAEADSNPEDDSAGPVGRPVYYFDTSEIRQRLPEGSNRTSAAVDQLLAPHIDAALGPSDVKVASDDGYFVLFGELDHAQAEAKAQALANAILVKAFGTQRAIPSNIASFWRRSSLRAASDALRRVARAAARAANRKPVDYTEIENAENIASLNAALEQVRNGRKFMFSPIWDATAERVAGHFCHQRGHTVAYAVSNPAAQCAFDRAALAVARTAALELADRQSIALIRVPVHLETLAWSRQREIYLSAVSALGRDLLGLVAFEVVGFTEGSSLTQVSHAVTTLKRHARRIFLRMPIANLETALAGVVGVAALGLLAPGGAGNPKATLATLEVSAGRLRRLCARQGAIAYIDRVASLDALEVVRACGIRLVTGDILPAPAEAPDALYPLSFEDIVRSVRGRDVMVG
ncbi:MAG TPA: hypothetical protein VHW02_04850 [Rhizomicrobium sp.]|jgi:hypothetical protein|nr:hypothetical protein [Rhizomicrobium sp.]